MSRAVVPALLAVGLLLCPTVLLARPPRAQCGKLCADALDRCRGADERRQCHKQVRSDCRRNGPQIVCRPSYTGTWTFAATGELTDTCGLAADLTALMTMVVFENATSDVVRAEFGPAGEVIAGYVRWDGSTILEGTVHIGGCTMVPEVYILLSASLPRYAADGRIHAGGICEDGRTCDLYVEGRWSWQPE